MAVGLMRKLVRSASSHPILMFVVFSTIWLYKSFPPLFYILIYSFPVISSTLFMLGTLLFYGHENESQQEGKQHHNKINNNLEIGGMRKTEIGDPKHGVSRGVNRKPFLVKRYVTENGKMNALRNARGGHVDEESKGWETGSDLHESSSPSASMVDIYSMLDDLRPQSENEVPFPLVSTDAATDQSLESGDFVNDTDDEEEDDQEDEEGSGVIWREVDQRNLVNLGTSELERNQILESLIVRQKALKNMRIQAEKKMESISPNLQFSDISNSGKNHFDHPYNFYDNNLGFAHPALFPRRNPFEPYDPSGQKSDRVGPTFQSGHRHEIFGSGPSTLGSYPTPERTASARKSTGSFQVPDMSEYMIQRRRFSEDNRTMKRHPGAQGYERSNEVNVNDGRTCIQKENPSFHHVPSGQKSDQVGPTFQSNPGAFRKNQPLRRQHEIFGLGPSTLGSDPTPNRVASARKSTGSFYIPDMNEYIKQRRRLSEDNRTMKRHPDAQGGERIYEFNVNDESTRIQKETSSFHRGHKSNQVGPTSQSDSVAFRRNEPSIRQHDIFGLDPSTIGSYPTPERNSSARKSTGSFFIPDMSEYTNQRRRFSEDNRTMKLHPDAQGDYKINEVNANDDRSSIKRELSSFQRDTSGHKSNRVDPTFQSKSVAFQKNEPLGRQHENFGSRPSTLGSYPSERNSSSRKSTGSFYIPDMNEYTNQRRRFSEDNRTVKIHQDALGDGNTGYKEKTFTKSTSSYYDVPDDICNEKTFTKSTSSYYDVPDDISNEDDDERTLIQKELSCFHHDISRQRSNRVGPTFQSKTVSFQKNEPLGRQHEIFGLGPSTLGLYPTSERNSSSRKSTGSFYIPDISEYTNQRRRFSEDNHRVKIHQDAIGDGNTGYKEKTFTKSTSSYYDVPDDISNEKTFTKSTSSYYDVPDDISNEDDDERACIQKELSSFHHDINRRKPNRVGPTFRSKSVAFRTNEPLGRQHEIFGSGPSTLESYPTPERISSSRKSTGSFYIPDMSEYTNQRRRFSEDNRIVKINPDALRDGNIGYAEKTLNKTISSYYDVPDDISNEDDDNEEADYRSPVTQDSKEPQIGNSSVDNSTTGSAADGLPQGPNEEQNGVKSWLPGWKA